MQVPALFNLLQLSSSNLCTAQQNVVSFTIVSNAIMMLVPDRTDLQVIAVTDSVSVASALLLVHTCHGASLR
jgi:hypothetical protein